MSHTFLSLDMVLIPQSTKDNVPTFYKGMFSNDNSRMLIDGRNKNGELVHPIQVLKAWTQWSDDPQQVIDDIISASVEYTREQIKAEQVDVNSIWYIDPEELV